MSANCHTVFFLKTKSGFLKINIDQVIRYKEAKLLRNFTLVAISMEKVMAAWHFLTDLIMINVVSDIKKARDPDCRLLKVIW